MSKLTVLTIGLLFISYLSYGQSKNFIDQPYLETTAKVDTLVTPDKIYLSLRITEKETKGKNNLEEFESLMGEKLKAIGINLQNQLTVSDLSSNFKNYFIKKQDIIKSKAYQILVYDTKTAGEVIYEMKKIGISNIDFERTEYSKIEELELKLKSQAVKKAKSQAEALIKPLNQKIGSAMYILDKNTQTHNNIIQGKVSGIQIGNNNKFKEKYISSIPIEFEKIKVECEVIVKFIITK